MIRDEIRQQQKKMEGKSRAEKLQYFWYYYKVHVLGGAFGLFAVVFFVVSTVRGSREPFLYVALINSNLSSAEDTELMRGYELSRQIDTSASPLRLDYSMRITDSFTDDVSLASSQQLMVHMNSGDVDVYIGNQWLIDEYASLDAYDNLEELLPDSALSLLDGKLYYAQVEGKGRIPVAFYADEVALLQKEQLYGDSVRPMVAISRTSKHQTAAVDFVKYLLGQ